MIRAEPLRFEWATASDANALASWDAFLRDSPRGHYCQLSTWLGSFRSYGFSFEVLLARPEGSDRIVGGAGVLWFGVRPFRLAMVPVGPIVEVGYETAAPRLVGALSDRSRSRGSVFLQIQPPRPADAPDAVPSALSGSDSMTTALLDSKLDLALADAREGAPVRFALAPGRMLWVSFGDRDESAWPDSILNKFSPKTRRDIRVSERSGLQLVEAKSPDELRSAYSIIEENGRLKGYATRSWRDFGPTVKEQVRRGQAAMLTAIHQGRPVGAQYGVVAGKRYSSVMGGTARVDPGLNVGRFLHWKAIERAHAMGLAGYDLTSLGSPGVAQVKLGFRPQNIALQRPVHIVFGRHRTRLFLWLHSRLYRNKKALATALSRMRRLTRGP